MLVTATTTLALASSEPPPELAPAGLGPTARRVDGALCAIAEAVQWLPLVTPIDLERTWREFEAARFLGEPKLSYPRIELDRGVLRKRLLALALDEDLGRGDVTTEACVPAGVRGEAVVRARTELVLSGIDLIREVYRQVDGEVEVHDRARDGEVVAAGGEIAQIELVGSEYDPKKAEAAKAEQEAAAEATKQKSVGERLRAAAQNLRGTKKDSKSEGSRGKASKPARGQAKKTTTPRKAGGS